MRSPRINMESLISFVVICSFITLLCYLPSGCALTPHQLTNKDINTLKNLFWEKSTSTTQRKAIVRELENRRAVDALISCLNRVATFRHVSIDWYKSGIEETLSLIKAIGRLKASEAIPALQYVIHSRITEKEVVLAVLAAYREIGDRRAALPTTELLSDSDHEIRWQALITLGHLKDPESRTSIYPLLSDENPNVRMGAIHALGEIGHPEAIDQVSLLLSDNDISIRGSAESALRKLGIPEETIRGWKIKATELKQKFSIEDLYRSKVAYKKVFDEKQELEVKLESEKDIKEQLENVLKSRDETLKKQQTLVQSLYEKERQLKSKVFQLEQAQKKSEANRKSLASLKNRAEEINKELRQNKSQEEPRVSKEELSKILEAKSKLEEEANNLKEKEAKLRNEVSSLSTIAEKTRIQAEGARKELDAKRQREMDLVRQVENLELRLESETGVKRQLEEALKEQNEALKRQKTVVTSLYEKERQLKNKLSRLEEAQAESERNRRELEWLKNRAEEINRDLIEKKDTTTKSVKEELSKILLAKTKLEAEAERLKRKETTLSKEVKDLSATAETTRFEAEKAKKELESTRMREAQLARQVDDLKKRIKRGMPPVLVVSKPKNGSKIESPTTLLHIIAVDDKGIAKINISLNDKPIRIGKKRGLEVVSLTKDSISKQIDITERLKLQYGENTLRVSVTDIDGMTKEELIRIIREKERGKIWAVVIGINQYQNTRDLKYALNDAKAFRNYLKEYIGIPEEHLFFLHDRNATRENIQSLLGTQLRRKASKDDTVIIFYAGHGAAETDPLDPDGDGFEKYLLPYDAKLDDLYSTAIAMEEIKKIFQRIHAERLIFIADTCYSGASGGRTMLASKTRATLSEKFFERISRGKGRVIISACSANETSKEDDDLRHGVFSYYLLKGLKGEADFDGDEIITVSELFSFLSRKVPEASGQDQHPVQKGETEGELVIGRVK